MPSAKPDPFALLFGYDPLAITPGQRMRIARTARVIGCPWCGSHTVQRTGARYAYTFRCACGAESAPATNRHTALWISAGTP